MAFDGLVINNLRKELAESLIGGRINKIYQPEKDEIHLIIKNQRQTYRLLLSASASLPLIYLTEKPKSNPMTAPNFCMLLRKYLMNGKILDVTQPGLERILVLHIEHVDEMGDLCVKKLIIEIMGKHSNIIFVSPEDKIIDSIKHVSFQVSSVREVLPGRDYLLPPNQDKLSIFDITKESFIRQCFSKNFSLEKAIYTSFQGISPVMARELIHQAGLDYSISAGSLLEYEQDALYQSVLALKAKLEQESFTPTIVLHEGQAVEFASFPLAHYGNVVYRIFESISSLLEEYYALKESTSRIRQKSSDLRKIITTALERNLKKHDLQYRQLEDTEKREKYKIYGELLHTYGYNLEPGAKSLTCINYYDNEEITIPLDKDKTAMENAASYFNRYNKLKRTYEALSELILETKSQIDHLESILTSLDMATSETDLTEIKEELIEYGYMKRKGGKNSKREKKEKGKPLHYISSDGFHMYVGKNNYQNEELTFKFANGKDMWFHAKGMAGSHVIVKLEMADELPDRTYEEAGRLAAYYSKGRQAPKVEIDYTERRNLKKPPKANPGFVIYHTNWSLNIEPDITGIQMIES